MAQAQSAAKAAALARLGYAVPEHDAGTLVLRRLARFAGFVVALGRPDRDGG